MATRKKPQQQLACYFDELLTELDEPQSLETPIPNSSPSDTATAIGQAHTNPKPKSVAKDVVEERLRDKPYEPPVKSVLEPEKRSPLSSNRLDSAKPLLEEAEPLALKARTPTTNDSRPLMDRGDTVEAVQKEKLQRLLRNLLPSTEDIPLEQQQFFEEKLLAQPNIADIEPADDNQATTTEYIEPWQPLESQWEDNGRPAWAQAAFDILLLDVQGIKVAVPLAGLDAIYPIDSNITPLFGQADWFMGLQKTLIGNIKLVNTAQFIMPERYKKDRDHNIQYNVAINGSGWGLGVDDINQPLVTYPEDIRWRVNRSKRPWVAGTVTEHMCILLDIPMLVEQLALNKSQ